MVRKVVPTSISLSARYKLRKGGKLKKNSQGRSAPKGRSHGVRERSLHHRTLHLAFQSENWLLVTHPDPPTTGRFVTGSRCSKFGKLDNKYFRALYKTNTTVLLFDARLSQLCFRIAICPQLPFCFFYSICFS